MVQPDRPQTKMLFIVDNKGYRHTHTHTHKQTQKYNAYCFSTAKLLHKRV